MKKVLNEIQKVRESFDEIVERYESSKLVYKKYYTFIHYDAFDKILWGQIEGIEYLVDFKSESATEIENEFHKAVDDYIEFCKEIGKNSERRGNENK